MGGYSVTDPTYDALNTSDDDPKAMLAKIMSPASVSSLVGPPPDVAPKSEPGQSTPRTGNLNAAPQQAVPKNRDTGTGYNMPLTGVSNPPNGGVVNSTATPAQETTPQSRFSQLMQRPQQPAPSMPNAVQGTLNGVIPQLPQAAKPNVQGDPLNMQTQADQSRLSMLKNTGSGVSQIQNPFLRGLARVGDVAGSIIAPGIAAQIPGTTLHNQQLIGRQQALVGQDQAQSQAQAQLADTTQQTNERAAKAAGEQPFTVTQEQAAAVGMPALEGATLRPADYGKLPQQGLKNAGVIAKDDDPNSYQAKNAQSLSDVRQTQQALNQAKAELAAAGNDPRSPAYQLALRKANTASSNASAANIRARAYALNANVGNLGVDNSGNPVNGINTLNGKAMGTRVAPQAAKAMGNISKFQDVYSSIDNANEAIAEGEKNGAKFNTAAMAEALSDPKTTSAQWLAGKVNTTLTPQEQNIVITTKALHEQIMAMRGAIGSGGVSDTQANRLIAQLPSATTPDMGYARKQLATVRQQLDRLQTGLPGVNNGPKLQAPNSPAAPTNPGGVPKAIPRLSAPTKVAGAPEVWVRGADGKLVKQ